MSLSNGRAPVGAHIPKLVPLRETAKLPPNASTLRAIRRATGQNHSPAVIEPGLDYASFHGWRPQH
jgi:hypothetical protein